MKPRQAPFGALISALTILAALSGAGSAAGQVPFRLAYVEAEPYWSYDEHFDEFKKALEALGWGGRVSYPPELHFSWGERTADYPGRARSLLAREDCDLILSFGTEASRVLLAENKKYGRRILGLSISNPQGAGLIDSPEDSGSPHFSTISFGEVPGPYMFVLFHHLVKFKKLGLMYQNSRSGRAYAYLDDARQAARDRGFELVEHSAVGPRESPEDCLAAVEDLIGRGVDAIFIPNIQCFGAMPPKRAGGDGDRPTMSGPVRDGQTPPSPYIPEKLVPIYEKIYQSRVATFAAEDEAQVRLFALMGLLFSDPESLGALQAEQAVRILSGEEPGSLPMVAPFRCQFLLNLAAAERLGLSFGPEVVSLSDRLYLTLPGLEPTPAGP